MAERLAPPTANTELLVEALKAKKKREEEKLSVEEARQHVPELEIKILGLLGIEIPKPPTPQEEQEMSERLVEKAKAFRKIDSEEWKEIVKKVQLDIASQFEPITSLFEVPVDDGTVSVYLFKGRRSSGFTTSIDSSLEVDVLDLDHVFRIDHGRATVESKAHRHKQFDMHTPMGSSSDLGPVWSRNMNMEDYNNYNSLLETLTDPKVTRVEYPARG